jgi:hypothetical protein
MLHHKEAASFLRREKRVSKVTLLTVTAFQTYNRKDWSGMHFVWSNKQETNAHGFVYKVGLSEGSVKWSHGKKKECAGRLEN